jgi:hypothetical protein
MEMCIYLKHVLVLAVFKDVSCVNADTHTHTHTIVSVWCMGWSDMVVT